MPYDTQKHHRRSIRLKGYDYTLPGAYFVTMITYHRENIFGEIMNGEVHLNQVGKIVKSDWLKIPLHFKNASLDEYIIMSNHLHGIICMGEASAEEGYKLAASHHRVRALTDTSNDGTDASPRPLAGTQPGSIGAIIQNFISMSARKTNRILDSSGNKKW